MEDVSQWSAQGDCAAGGLQGFLPDALGEKHMGKIVKRRAFPGVGFTGLAERRLRFFQIP